MAAVRPLPRPTPHLQLLGARHRQFVIRTDHRYEQLNHANCHNHAPRKILVLGATSGIAEATCRIWASRARASSSSPATPRSSTPSPRTFAPAAPATSTPPSPTSTTPTPSATARPRRQLAHRHGHRLPRPRHPRRPGPAEQDFNTAAQILHTNLMAPGLAAHLAGQLLRPAPHRRTRRHLFRGRRSRPQIQLRLRLVQGRPLRLPRRPAQPRRPRRRHRPHHQARPHPHRHDRRHAQERKVRRRQPGRQIHRQRHRQAKRTTSTSRSTGSPSCSSSATFPSASSRN